MNLKFKSSEPDLKFNIQAQFRILNQNVLYLTRETDAIKRILTDIQTKQETLDYYGKKYGEELGSAIEGTSPQTETEQ